MLPGKVRLDGRLGRSAAGELMFVPYDALQSPPPLNEPATFYCEGVNNSGGKPLSMQASISAVESEGLAIALDSMTDANSVRALNQLLTCGAAPESDTSVTVPNSSALASFQTQALTSLDEKLQVLMIALIEFMLDLSSSGKTSSSGHNLHYEAMNSFKRGHRDIINRVLDQIREQFEDLTPTEKDAQDTQAGTRDLDLVDLNEFEDYLAIDRMVTLGEDLHHVALEALIIRTAEIAGKDPMQVRLPIHVASLSGAFHRALDGNGIPHQVIPEIFGFFQHRFIRELGDYYAPLNASLSAAGIRPGLEDEIISKGSLLKRPDTSRPSAGQQAPDNAPVHETTSDNRRAESFSRSDTLDIGSEDATPADMRNRQDETLQRKEVVEEVVEGVVEKISKRLKPDDLYRSVIDALNFRRESAGLSPESATQPGAYTDTVAHGHTGSSEGTNLADANTIANVLGQLQQDAAVRAAIQQGDSLREYLAANAAQIGELEGTSGLAPDTLNQLDLVDNLFGTIKSQLDVSTELQPALGDLQIPVAKLALNEPQFFVDRGHSARGVLDKLSQLASSGNFPNKALESRVGEIVDDIVSDYDHDSSVFDQALSKIDKLVSQQEKAHQRNVERVVRTQEGQAKLARAQREVDQVLGARIRPPSAPKVLADLAEAGLRDMLVLTHVKEGPNSDTWKDHVKTLDTLAMWLTEQVKGSVDPDQQAQRAMEADSIIDMIEQQISSALPASIAHESVLHELRDTISGVCPVATRAIAPREQLERTPEERRKKIESLPRLRRWVRRVEQLDHDNWLSYRDKDNRKQRMQLAWISEEKDRYIFVNERGQKIADLNSVQLARQLSRGVQPPPPADKMSVVDQSMYGTLEHVQKTLSFDRNHDSLTKLINRATFEDQLKRALRHAHRKGSQHAVLVLNIDKFSLVNDVYDRVNGDQVLLEFAHLLSQLHGKKTSSARLGADEFGVLLLDRPMPAAIEIAEKIRSDIEASNIDVDGERVSFTVSIGAAPIRDYSNSVEEVLKAASGAMQLAKAQGRNRVMEFNEDQERTLQHRQEQQSSRKDLEQALATDRFVLRAQPIVQSAVGGNGGDSAHFELLLSLTNNDGSLGSPEEFIQSAERHGFMSLVDRWVVREAFEWISSLMDAQKVVPSLAINLSGQSVTEDSFLDYLLEQISEFGVGTSKLCFEITETGTIANLVKAADFVRTFRNIGCKFSIDDFGTGLASHNYLRELPVDYVKIDGTFIKNIHTNRNDYAMARSINDLAHFLGQATIAESVENDEVVATLREIGVDYLQGWGVGRPKLLSDITAGLSSVEK